jgi:nicotinamidase-related amidase
MPPARLSATDSALLVIDVQDKLLPAIANSAELLTNLTFLLDVARLLDVPILATEQYPKGLGPTAAAVAERLPALRPAKVAFSCAAVPEVIDALDRRGRSVVVAGIESHVCVLQTTLDLLHRGLTVFVAADAIAGRFSRDNELALRRMERAGAILTTVETTAFEWLGSAGAPQFKAVSALVQERMRRLRQIPTPVA